MKNDLKNAQEVGRPVSFAAWVQNEEPVTTRDQYEATQMNEDQLEPDGDRDADPPECDAHSGQQASFRPALLTAAQAAEMLCISEATLWELVKRDRLRCVQFVASGFRRPVKRFRVQDVIRFIEESVD
jgi:hypothetical protein